MKRTDKIFALRRVDARLAADARIHLRQQRRGDLHEADAAADDRSREACQVADHAAAESQHDVAAFETHA